MHQMTLFDRPSVNTVARMKAAMREAIRLSGLSRDQVADKMTEIARAEGIRMAGNARAVSKAILDKWMADGASHVIPLPMLPVFCVVVGCHLPMQVLSGPLGLGIIDAAEAKLLEWARAEMSRQAITKEVRRLKEEIRT